MSDTPRNKTPRNKVNIVAICAANLAGVSERIEAAYKAVNDARDQVSAINSRHKEELGSSKVELDEIMSLIEANQRLEVPTEKLEKKSLFLRERIEKVSLEHLQSKELADSVAAIEIAEAELKAAEDLRELFTERLRLAEELKAAFVQSDLVGAIEAPEYQTLDEALDDYIKDIPLMVSISENMTVDVVGMWHVPNASVPFLADVYAHKAKPYKFNRLPNQLSWLRQIPGSSYASMPIGGDADFKVGDVIFTFTENNDDAISKAESDEESDKIEREWMGKMYPRFARNDSSLFAPDGINYSTQKGLYTRSGLCYIRSEDRFYSLWSEKFPSISMVPGNVNQSDRWGNVQTVEGSVPKGVHADLTKLTDSFFKPLADRIKIAAEELLDLSCAKSPLALRFKGALDRVCVLESQFELSGKRLSEDEVNAEVGAYWEAFVKAPWEPDVIRDVAMIKHLCSRKIEAPHVWSLPIKGHYGLRVRTRDHDWILAQIYCPPESLSPKTPIAPDDVVYCSDGYVKVGPCLINVIGRDR